MRKWNMILGRKKRWCFRADPEPTRPRLNRFTMLRRKFWLSWRGAIAIGYLYFGIAALFELAGAYILMLLGHPFEYDFFGTGLKENALSVVAISFAAVPFMMLFIRPAQHAIIQRKKGLRAYVIAHRCQICPRCLYDLQGRSNADDTCPECGQVASRRECVRLWGRYLQSF